MGFEADLVDVVAAGARRDSKTPPKRRRSARRWRAKGGSHVRTRLAGGARPIRTCMGLFLSSGVFGLLPVLCSERERPFFVPSPAIRFPERAEGVKGPKR